MFVSVVGEMEWGAGDEVDEKEEEGPGGKCEEVGVGGRAVENSRKVPTLASWAGGFSVPAPAPERGRGVG